MLDQQCIFILIVFTFAFPVNLLCVNFESFCTLAISAKIKCLSAEEKVKIVSSEEKFKIVRYAKNNAKKSDMAKQFGIPSSISGIILKDWGGGGEL